MSAILSCVVDASKVLDWNARLHKAQPEQGSVFIGGIQFFGTPDQITEFARKLFAAAANLRVQQIAACEGSELPDAEYPYGSAVGTAA